MRLLIRMLLVATGLLLAACGAYAPPAPTRSALEEMQTSVALQARPTLAPVDPEKLPTPAPRPPLPDVAEALRLRPDDPRALGAPDAPVLLIEFTDYECPFCQQFFRDTRPQIIESYVQTGAVRFVARDFPLADIHASAPLAAAAGQCAAEQGQFWPMYERLFATHQEEWGGVPRRDREVFIEFAGDLGLDGVAFGACLDDPATLRRIDDEQAAAARFGVNSTPNFLVNGQLLRGALPFRVFEDLIEQELKR